MYLRLQVQLVSKAVQDLGLDQGGGRERVCTRDLGVLSLLQGKHKEVLPTRGLVITYLTGLVHRLHRVKSISRQEKDPRALRDRTAGVTFVTGNPVLINHLGREGVKARKCKT